MKNLIKAVAITAVLALAAVPSMAGTYTIDASHSDASFVIRHIVSKVRGNFSTFEGVVHFDPASMNEGSVSFEIDAASINTGNAKRDGHLRGEDFFDVEKFPKITFVSKSFEKTGDNTFDVAGTLTMRGVSKEVVLPVGFLGEANDPWGGTRAGFETAITLDRKDYGINWNAALDQGGFVLGDDVKIEVNLEVIKEKAETTGG